MFKGIDAYYTPFIRLEKGHEFRPRDLRDCDPSVNTVERLIPQVLGGEPGELRLALTMLREKGFQQADINLGCPFPMIARKGKGAGLLPFPEKVKALLDILGEFKDITCSLKMRLGMERPDECLALAERVMPGLGSMVDDCHTSTPLTYRDYTGTPEGSAYGLRKDYHEPLTVLLSPRTPVPNLWLTGQSLMLHGLHGVTMTALRTCAELL